MIPHMMQHQSLVGIDSIPTASMDGSANDRATKRQKGEINDSNHTVSTASSSSVEESTCIEETPIPVAAAQESLKEMIGKKYRRVHFAPVTNIHSTDWTRDEVDSGWYSVSY